MRIPYQLKGIVVSVLLTLVTSLCVAQEVSIKHKGISLLAEYMPVSPAGKQDKNKPILLLVHGTMAHGRMEIIKSLQDLLKSKAYGSLAITLSLNINKRRGMGVCDILHTHKHDDALAEIDRWTKWLVKKGYKNIILLGHSRGGSQVTRFMLKYKPAVIKKLVLLAPMSHSRSYIVKSYNAASKRKLAEVIKLAASLKPNKKITDIQFLHCSKANVIASSFLGYYNIKDTETVLLLAKLKLPIKVFAGSDDKMAAGLIPAMKKVIKQQNINLEVIDGARHFFRDLYLEDVVDSLVKFIKV